VRAIVAVKRRDRRAIVAVTRRDPRAIVAVKRLDPRSILAVETCKLCMALEIPFACAARHATLVLSDVYLCPESVTPC
jgi:hypothetical protein